MRILNVGCGNKIFDYAENLDIRTSSIHSSVIQCDVNDIEDYCGDEKVDIIFMLCPHRYYPLRTKAYNVLKNSGLLIITGTFTNTFFSEVWYAPEDVLEELGYITLSKTQHCHNEFWNSKQTGGQPIPNHALKQIILKKR